MNREGEELLQAICDATGVKSTRQAGEVESNFWLYVNYQIEVFVSGHALWVWLTHNPDDLQRAYEVRKEFSYDIDMIEPEWAEAWQRGIEQYWRSDEAEPYADHLDVQHFVRDYVNDRPKQLTLLTV